MQCMPAPIRIPMIFVSIAINSPIVMSFEIFAILKFLLEMCISVVPILTVILIIAYPRGECKTNL